jgi:hypothetical protein
LCTVALVVSATAFAGGDDFGRWNWPLVSEWQTYESGTTGPKEGTVGGLAWPSTKPLTNPYQAARYGTLNQGQPGEELVADPQDQTQTQAQTPGAEKAATTVEKAPATPKS